MFFGAPITAAAAQGATAVDKFTTGFGKQDYNRPALIGATLLEVFYGGQTLQTLVAPADYTFNSATGTIIFTLIVSSNVEANILYLAAP